jgi:hypothetical protein
MGEVAEGEVRGMRMGDQMSAYICEGKLSKALD